MLENKVDDNELIFHVAGTRYYDMKKVLGRLEIGEELDIVPEPDNPYDSNAIALYCYHDDREYKLGFVPKGLNKTIIEWINDFESVPRCSIASIEPLMPDFLKLQVRIFKENFGVSDD